MKVFPSRFQFRLSWALTFFSLIVAAFVIILVSGIVYIQVGHFFEKMQDEMTDKDVTEITMEVKTFLKYRLIILTDHARFPVITQGVMQPEAIHENLVDFMGGLSLLGSKCQLALLDYQGKSIYSTRENPQFDYTSEEWFHQIIEGNKKEYVGISRKDGNYFWRISVPVLYNNHPEGALVAEVEVTELGDFQNISQVIQHYQIELVSNGTIIASFGSDLHGEYEEFPIENIDLVLRYKWDRNSLYQARSNLIVEIIIGILVVISMVIIAALFLADRLYVRPLLKLRRLVHTSTEDTEIDHIPIDQNLLEISALAMDFNWMIAQRNHREEDLIIARNDLEQRVRERTKELQLSQEALQKINDNLELRIQERSQELDRIHNQMVIQEKMASVGQLAAGIAHELNNPINFVRTNFATLMDNFSDLLELFREYQGNMAETEKDVVWQKAIAEIRILEERLNLSFLMEDIPVLFDESEQGFQRIAKIIQSMRDFSRVDQVGELSWASMNKGIEDTLVIAKNEYKYHAEVTTNLGDVAEIYCSIEQINQVFLNLIVNSAHAIAELAVEKKGCISISTWQEDAHVFCEIKDNGPGIPEEHRNRIFEPFFTTKPPGQGTGLGLSISYDIIVRKHKGQFMLDCPEGGGAVFTIILPLESPEERLHEMR